MLNKKRRIWNVGLLLQVMFNLPEHCKEIRIKSRAGKPVEIESDHYVTVDDIKQLNCTKTAALMRTVKVKVNYTEVKTVVDRIK